VAYGRHGRNNQRLWRLKPGRGGIETSRAIEWRKAWRLAHLGEISRQNISEGSGYLLAASPPESRQRRDDIINLAQRISKTEIAIATTTRLRRQRGGGDARAASAQSDRREANMGEEQEEMKQ